MPSASISFFHLPGEQTTETSYPCCFKNFNWGKSKNLTVMSADAIWQIFTLLSFVRERRHNHFDTDTDHPYNERKHEEPPIAFENKHPDAVDKKDTGADQNRGIDRQEQVPKIVRGHGDIILCRAGSGGEF